MQSTVYFSLGSNLGDRYSNLSECVSLIESNVENQIPFQYL